MVAQCWEKSEDTRKDGMELRRTPGEHGIHQKCVRVFQEHRGCCGRVGGPRVAGGGRMCSLQGRVWHCEERIQCSSPGPSPPALGSSPLSSCQLSRKRVEVRDGRAGEGKEDMRHHVCFAVTGFLQLKMTPRQQYLPRGRSHRSAETRKMALPGGRATWAVPSSTGLYQWVRKSTCGCLRTTLTSRAN